MNAENVKKVIELIKAHKAQFNMRQYFKYTGNIISMRQYFKYTGNIISRSCNTASCIAGFAWVLEHNNDDWNCNTSVQKDACKILDLQPRWAEMNLFEPAYIANLDAELITADDGIYALTRMLELGDPEQFDKYDIWPERITGKRPAFP
jgi:hypothetical protein